MIDGTVLNEPADRGVRRIALALLGNAEKTCKKLVDASSALRDGDEESDDALHDFRVAVRRLRSWIRAFQPSLRDAVSRKQRRRLSEIADATGAIRDATVHLEWLRTERRGMGVRQRVGEAWLRKRLESQRSAGADAAIEAAYDFDKIVAKLERRMSVYCAAVIEERQPASFGAIIAERIVNESEELHMHLAAIHGYADVEEAHQARIAAKRLRYVMEPIRELVADSDAIIETLKQLQDSLGDLHDVHVFAAEVEAAAADAAPAPACPGLLRLARRLRERGARAYARIERDWLNDADASFFDRVRDLATEIERRALAARRATSSPDP